MEYFLLENVFKSVITTNAHSVDKNVDIDISVTVAGRINPHLGLYLGMNMLPTTSDTAVGVDSDGILDLQRKPI